MKEIATVIKMKEGKIIKENTIEINFNGRSKNIFLYNTK